MLIITIPKGRIFSYSIFLLKRVKILIIEKIFRKIILKTNRKNIFILIIKNKDITKLLKLNYSNLGIIGLDNVKKNKFLEVFRIKSYLFLINNNNIITKFINILSFYKFKKKILKINGSCEGFFYKNNGLLDISESNKTIYENNLIPGIFILKIKIIIILNNFKKKMLKIFKKC